MITARNYAAQAEKGLLLFSKDKRNHPSDRKTAETISEIIHYSTHFALPDDAEIFNDDLKGLYGNYIELPYKAITIEFHLTGKWSQGVKGNALLTATSTDYNSDIIIFGAYFYPVMMEYWQPVCYSMSIQKNLFIDNKRNTANMNLKIVCPGIYSIDKIENHDLYMIGSLELSLHEMLEALQCKNVKEGIQQQYSPSNDKRIKQGKLPIYETKILTIDTSYSASGRKEAGSGTHASPRQHLRRGHIRRLPSGNIWINSCVVGDPSKGTIHKQYRVK